jgi:hypothetical protein
VTTQRAQRFVLRANDTTRVNVLANAQRFLAELSASKSWRVEVCEHRERRSDAQNRYLWGVCYAELHRATGQESEDWHEYMLGECYGWETVEMMGRKKLRPMRRSSKMDRKEFAEYVEFIQRRAAEHGIFIPDPDPFYADQMAA